MSRSKVDAPSEITDFIRLRQLGKDTQVPLSNEPINLSGWPGRMSLFATSNQTGYFAAGLNDSFIVSPLLTLRQAFAPSEPYHSQYRTPLPSQPIVVKFTADGQRLVVCTRDGHVLLFNTPNDPHGWKLDATQDGPSLPLTHEFSHSTAPVRDVLPNPSDRMEMVAVLRGSPGSGSTLEILDTQTCQIAGSIPGGDIFQTAAAWSPKGKQITIGNRAGQLAQYGVDGSPKGVISAPDDSTGRSVVSVAWLEPTTFLVSYSNTEEEHDYITYVIVHDTKAGKTTDIAIEDPTAPWGNRERESAKSFVDLKSWSPTKHMLFVADAPADEIGVVACFDSDSRWTKLDLDDTARATLPMSDGDPLTLIGFDVDLTSTTPISTSTQFGDDSPPLPPAPILMGYTNEGKVLAYHVLNSQTTAYPSMTPISVNPAPAAVPPTDTAPAVSSSVAPSIFGANSGPSTFGQGTFGAGTTGSLFGKPAFGATTTPIATPSKPGTGFGQPAFGSTTTPAFGQSGFGASSTPTFQGFGTTPAATPAFGQSGFGFGASTTPTPAFGASTAGGFSGFGTRPGGFGGFGTATTTQTSTTTTPAASSNALGFGSFASTTPQSTPTPTPTAATTTTPAKTPSKVPELASGSGAFGSSISTPPISFTTPKEVKPTETFFGGKQTTTPAGPPPTFGAPSLLAASTTPTTKPVFGAPTAFGAAAFGSTAAPKAAANLPAIKVSSGSAFGSFSSTSAVGGFAGFGATAGSGGSFGALLSGGDDKSEPPKSAMSMTSASPAPRSAASFGTPGQLRDGLRDPDEEDDEGNKERFPESELENKEPTKLGGDFLPVGSSPQPKKQDASPFSFDSMSLGSRPSPLWTSPAGSQSLFVPQGGASPLSAIPMSTTTITFPGSETPRTAVTPVAKPKTPEPEPEEESVEEQEDEGEEKGEEEEEEEEEGEEDAEGGDDDEDEGDEQEDDFVISASGSEEEGSDEEGTADLGGSSYVIAEKPNTPSAEDTLSTPRAPQRSNSTTPVGTPAQLGNNADIGSPASGSSSPSPPLQGSGQLSPTSEAGPARPFGLRGRSPFGSTPIVSSPLAKPPISGDSPTKEPPLPKLNVEAKKTPPGPPTPIEMPLPADDEAPKKPIVRAKTPPPGFGLNFGASSKAKTTPPSTGGVFGSGSSSSGLFSQPTPPPDSLFGQSSSSGGPNPTHAIGATSKQTLPAPAVNFGNLPKPGFGVSGFGVGGFGAPKTEAVKFGSQTAQPPSTSAPPSVASSQNATQFGFGGRLPSQPGAKLSGPSFSLQTPSQAAQPPKDANPMEASFAKIVQQTDKRLQELSKSVSDVRSFSDSLKRDAGVQGGWDEPRVGRWTFKNMKLVKQISIKLSEDLEDAEVEIVDMKRQIATMQASFTRSEARREQLRRLVQSRVDTGVADMAKRRSLGPEQEESQMHLRKLIEVVSQRVQQLELLVDDEKKRADRMKSGTGGVQTPTLYSLTRSMERIQKGAKTKTTQLEQLERRLSQLNLSDPLESNQSLVATDSRVSAAASATTASFVTAMSTHSPRIRGTRPQADAEIRAIASAALNGERAAARVKEAFLHARSGAVSAPCNPKPGEERLAPLYDRTDLRRTSRIVKQKTLPAWVQPERAPSTPLPQLKRADNSSPSSRSAKQTPTLPGGFSFSKDETPDTSALRPRYFGTMTPGAKQSPAKVVPFTRNSGRRGYGLHDDD